MFKLTLPEEDNHYRECIDHPNVASRGGALGRLLARRGERTRLARNRGVIASFSRALSEGLSAQQSDADFNGMLDESIGSIFAASRT